MQNKDKKPFFETFWGVILLVSLFPFTLSYLLIKSKISGRNKTIALAILWIVTLSFSWNITSQSDKQITKINEENKNNIVVEIEKKPELKKQYTTLSGIEKDQNSDVYGELVVELINLWEGTGNDKGKVIGKVPHGTKVEIVEHKKDEIVFYKVKTNSDLEGWISERFITEIIEE